MRNLDRIQHELLDLREQIISDEKDKALTTVARAIELVNEELLSLRGEECAAQ